MAGSCWYFLRYLDPDNEEHFVDSAVERYWMTKATEESLMLISCRWRSMLCFISLLVSGTKCCMTSDTSPVPTLQRLYNQGYIQAANYQDDRYLRRGRRSLKKMASSCLTDSRSPEASGKWASPSKFGHTGRPYSTYGADTLRSMKCSWDRWTKTGLGKQSR